MELQAQQADHDAARAIQRLARVQAGRKQRQRRRRHRVVATTAALDDRAGLAVVRKLQARFRGAQARKDHHVLRAPAGDACELTREHLASGLSNLARVGIEGRPHAFLTCCLRHARINDATLLSQHLFLTSVDVSFNAIRSLQPLAALIFLTELRAKNNLIEACPGFRPSLRDTGFSLAGDAGCLSVLDMSFNKVASLDAVRWHRFLVTLNLSNNGLAQRHRRLGRQFDDPVLAPLRSQLLLRELNVAHNFLEDLRGLEGLMLSTLVVSSNSLESLHVVATLPKLTSLNASRNAIRSLEHIAHSDEKTTPRLQHLNVASNLIAAVDELDHLCHCSFLASLVIDHNPFLSTGTSTGEALLDDRALVGRLPQLRHFNGKLVTCEEKVKADSKSKAQQPHPNLLALALAQDTPKL